MTYQKTYEHAGRPTLLTLELSRKIINKVREGVPPPMAAREMGVTKQLWHTWVSRGHEDQRLDNDSIFRDFMEAIEEARAAYLSEVVVLGDRKLKTGQFTSVKDFVLWLERQDPENFRKRETTEVIGNIAQVTKIEYSTTPEEEAERLVRTLELLAELGRIPRPALQEATGDVVDAEVDEVHSASTAPETSDLPDPD